MNWKRFGDEWPPRDRDILVKNDEGETVIWNAGSFLAFLGRDGVAEMVDDEPYGFDDWLWTEVPR